MSRIGHRDTPTYRGMECVACGGTLRYYSSNQCVPCKAERKRKRAAAERERRAAEAAAKGRTVVKKDTNSAKHARATAALYAEADHLRVRWVFDWRGPAPSQPNNVTGD